MTLKTMLIGIIFGTLSFVMTIVVVMLWDYNMLKILGEEFLSAMLIMSIIIFTITTSIFQKHIDELEKQKEVE